MIRELWAWRWVMPRCDVGQVQGGPVGHPTIQGLGGRLQRAVTKWDMFLHRIGKCSAWTWRREMPCYNVGLVKEGASGPPIAGSRWVEGSAKGRRIGIYRVGEKGEG